MGWVQALKQADRVWGEFRLSHKKAGRGVGSGSQSQGGKAWDGLRISDKETGCGMGLGSQR